MDGSSYGYAEEWTDSSGLQYLRARYYSPAQGRFISKDPFPGFQSQPSTLNAYAYVTNNPVLMSDPSGEIAPLLVAAGLGGLIGAGIDAGVQLYNMQPTSFGQAIRCMNWGEVGVSFGAGAVAGLTGFTVFSGVTALMGTGFLANVAAGAFSGVVAGQYGRLTELVLSGQISQTGAVLFRPQDIVLDAAIGGLFGGLAYGIGRSRVAVKPIVNNRGMPYPEVDVPGYGKVPFPDQPYTPNNSPSRAQEFTKAFKDTYKKWWINQGYTWPNGEVNIHHIKPLQFGGENIFENLVPLTRPQHDLFTNWWRYFK